MRATLTSLAIAVLLAALSPLQPAACIVERGDLEAARARSNAAVLGTVEYVVPVSQVRMGKTFRYRLRLGRVLAGELAGGQGPGDLLQVHHFEGTAYMRGDKLVCPQLSGSGLEGKLAAGESYVLLLRVVPQAGNSSVEIVRAEATEALETVAALFGVQPSELEEAEPEAASEPSSEAAASEAGAGEPAGQTP